MLAFSIFLLIAWLAWLTVRQNKVLDRLSKLERRALAPEPEARPVEAPLKSPEAIPERAAAPKTMLQAPEVDPVTDAAFAPAPPRELWRAARTGPEPREQIAAWLSENGLAWIGGAVLALGGLFMVAYAAQRGFFTPAMRIAGAVATGFVLLAVSEWLKRQADREQRGHRLAAAAAAGAGAATLYAAAWASYWLYDFISIGAAAGFLGLISLALLALAVRHGEPLAILAVGGALLAPAITGPQHWDAPALTAYLALVVVIGYVTAGARRWGQAGMTTLAGAALWAAAGFAAEGYVRVVALAVGPVALSIAALEWRRRRAPDERAALDNSFTLMPGVAIGVAAALAAGLWTVQLKGFDLGAATVGSGALLALAAFAVLRRLVPSVLQLAVYASAALVVVSFPRATLNPELEIWSGVLALAAAPAGYGRRSADVTSASASMPPAARWPPWSSRWRSRVRSPWRRLGRRRAWGRWRWASARSCSRIAPRTGRPAFRWRSGSGARARRCSWRSSSRAIRRPWRWWPP